MPSDVRGRGGLPSIYKGRYYYRTIVGTLLICPRIDICYFNTAFYLIKSLEDAYGYLIVLCVPAGLSKVVIFDIVTPVFWLGI